MNAEIVEELAPAFDIEEPPSAESPVVCNSPHSGKCYPAAFLRQSRLELEMLRRSEDTFVDELFSDAPVLGVPLMRAHFPRAYLDVNREPYELDPRMFEGRLPAFANTRSLRVAGGLGTVARVVGDAREIYPKRIPVAEALVRIEQFYKPYHRTLRKLVNRAQKGYGFALLLDCHSMPSNAGHRDERPRADFVLGDRYGTSCSGAITAMVERTLRAQGYVVLRNKPYAGGFITEHYGDPATGLHALQIEVNRGLYMDEARYEKAAGFETLKDNLSRMVAAVAAYTEAGLEPLPYAAE
ncbi:MAG: N-formylglutamate amidohydrolase [Xanthobacteraceae bacterium]|nr:N-formylglutamate amidohydrolase [Xanthobacteraceae bacterium]MCW5675042.1 N-formylglutamate amidohydrolase [Xanthobacteraceae bacterium]